MSVASGSHDRLRRRHPVRAVLCVVALAALTAGSCTGSPAPAPRETDSGAPVSGGTLNMLGSGDVDYMDPNVTYYTIGYLGLRMWSRQLFGYPAQASKATTAAPDLATELPTQGNGGVSADGRTYRITIRKGARWNTSPPRQVTAADAARGLERTCNPSQPFGGTPDFADLIVGYSTFCAGFAKVPQNPRAIAAYINAYDISGVEVEGDRTIVFKLTHPATYFVDMLTLPAFSPAPKEFLEYAPGSRELAMHTIANGPYRIESYAPTKQIVFTRNPAWVRASDPLRKAYVDRIVVDQTVSQESTQQQLQTGSAAADMQWDNFPPPSQLPALIARKDPNLNLGATDSTNPYLVFNTVSPNNSDALSRRTVRQALMYALDRDTIIQALGGPRINPPLTHVLPRGILGSREYNPYPHDVDKARRLLAAAGYPKGMRLKLLYRSSSEGGRKTFATVQQDLRAAGIRVEGVPVPNADFFTKYLQVPSVARRGVWDMALAGWGPDWYGNAALSFFGPLFAGPPSFPPTGSNFGFYHNPEVDRLVRQAAASPKREQATDLWVQADRRVMQDAAFFPITSPVQANYHASQVRGAVYIPALQNFDPTNLWIERGKQGG
jgi:peptide/nickel transport system substrate-binding protein